MQLIQEQQNARELLHRIFVKNQMSLEVLDKRVASSLSARNKRREYLLKAIEGGMTNAECAEEIGITVSSLRRFCSEENLVFEKANKIKLNRKPDFERIKIES